VKLYGEELLDPAAPAGPEAIVNGVPLKMRPYPVGPEAAALGEVTRMKGERFTDHFSGWGLVAVRSMGHRTYAAHPCFGVHYLVRRELADMTDLPCPGPGGPVVEAPCWVDTLTLGNWNWRFWGDDTRMIFPSSHSSGPSDEAGHVGYENDTPEQCKRFLQNVWRRIYPGVMAVHGGLFYNARTHHWIAITCRRPNVGYILNMTAAGRGVAYDFTLHAPFDLGQSLQMPEIKIYYGQTHEEMMTWLADYTTFYYETPPEWVHRTVFGGGLAWNNQPTWTQQGDEWERQLDSGVYSGIGYCLVTNRPVRSGTTPIGYEPDPNHGTADEFKAMCRRLAARGVPVLIWMSYSGLLPGGADIDDDWFIRGIDGRTAASWGSVDGGMSVCNPGHPGYIEYTCKWIRFYIRECGCKGIFMDCMGWAFPPDYRPRSFMRFPGDTNRMSVKFIEAIHACLKECDPQAILLGEGTTLEAPCEVFSMNHNPVRSIDGMGPREFFQHLNRWSSKRIVTDQGPALNPGSGYCSAEPGRFPEQSKYLARLLRDKGGPRAFVPLPGDLSVHVAERLLVVPAADKPFPAVRLGEPWQGVKELVDELSGGRFARAADGAFHDVPTGIYRMA
jgi:hypothetical protein